MRHKLMLLTVMVAVFALFAVPANAVITFDEFAVGTVISNQYAAQGVVFGPGDITANLPVIANDGAMPTAPVLSGYPPYNADFWMGFLTPMTEVSFISGYWNNIGSGIIDVYAWGGGLIGTYTNAGLGVQSFTFSHAAGIGRIHFNPIDDLAGADIDNLDLTPVPEPGTLFLMGTGLAGLGAAYRRRRALKK